jgi:hypothetical protein
MSFRIAAIAAASSFISSAALAGGGNPATLSICDDLSGPQFGLCNAYCEAQACHEESPLTQSCSVLLDNYIDRFDEAPPCEGSCYVPASLSVSHTVEVTLSADDVWWGYFDGVAFGGTNKQNWSTTDTLTFTADSGCHSIAVQVNDIGRVINGFIAEVKVDGVLVSQTGDGTWLATGTYPGAGWEDTSFDTTGWGTAQSCDVTTPWTWFGHPVAPLDYPTDLRPQGVEWVWDTSDCRQNLGQAWFRLDLQLD